MIKKILPILLLLAIPVVGLFSCKKTSPNTTDLTRNYFPLVFGKSVTYAVDSVYYYGSPGIQTEVKSQLKYTITDTFTDKQGQLSYIMDVYSRPYDGAIWIQHPVVILITPTATSLLYTQDGTQYIKLMFPVTGGFSWPGNQNAQIQTSTYAYLANWNYTYANVNLPYFNGLVNFNNTVTVQEDNEHVNYQNIDSAVAGYDTYAQEVYAYNVGMIYKDWMHVTWVDSAQNKTGYSVVMQAIDYQ
jgi:hypothetical protein